MHSWHAGNYNLVFLPSHERYSHLNLMLKASERFYSGAYTLLLPPDELSVK